MAIFVFLFFVVGVMALCIRASRSAGTAGGYFAAGNRVHWGVNGIAFAGGYLSTASFLGICGLIAFWGYDGFLYSIGFLAGWIVALFVVAEPMKRMGRYTFTDALNSRFNHPGIRLAAGLSTLVVSVCYLIPQMVGAGVLVEPLLGIPHYWGVIIVGAIVIFIVAAGGMTSTTYVQFFNGGLLLLFATVLTVAVLVRGVETEPHHREEGRSTLPHYEYAVLPAALEGGELRVEDPEARSTARHAVLNPFTGEESVVLHRLERLVPLSEDAQGNLAASIKGRAVRVDAGPDSAWRVVERNGQPHAVIADWWRKTVGEDGSVALVEAQSTTVRADGVRMVNGAPRGGGNRLRQMGRVARLPGGHGESTGPVGPFRIISLLSHRDTEVRRPEAAHFTNQDGDRVSVHYEEPTPGSTFMRPGLMFPIEPREGEPARRVLLNRLNVISLMMALFFGTAALPHILIRYYTVPSPACARKSAIVAIASIGFFYVLTMYLGLGSVISGALHPETSNMSAPLLARSFGEILFAIISAIAFTTVLATVSGLIVAASGAVAHDLTDRFVKRELSDDSKVRIGQGAAMAVGLVSILLGIAFRGMNVSFLVGWAFAVAASANLPALLMLLFWRKTTAQGVVASVLVGIALSMGVILLSPDMFARYGLNPASAPLALNQPGIISIPLSFLTLVGVSLATQKEGQEA